LTSIEYDGTEIALIGMAGRFPGARTVAELWRNLRDGVDAARRLTEEELAALGVPPAVRADPDFVPVTAQLPDLDRFDAAFFGFDHREAELLDPQQRILLELAWEALEDAGHDPEVDRQSVGVFAGASLSTYLVLNLSDPALRATSEPLQLLLGNSGDSLATRVSYKLNLKGPSFTVQSACSTALVATHLACASLLNGECDLALAGAVSVNVNLLAGYLAREGGAFSRDGCCRAFDAGAGGILFGHGGGVVVLKRLEDALAGGDAVRAVVRGSAVNNDGNLKVGYTAPSVEGQAEVLTEAWAAAGIEPGTLSYIEAHGTGTRLGDSIEAQALTRAFRTHTDRRGFCALGSVKTNIGHLESASGIASLIKTVLALEQRQIPPSLHCADPNPEIDLAAGPLRLATHLADWPAEAGQPRRAGVSAFGYGGTNAHVVLEEAPPPPSSPSRPWDLLLLSARTGEALERATDALAAHLVAHPALALSDVAWTLQQGRRRFEHRRALVCRTGEDATVLLRRRDPERLATLADEAADRVVVFLLPDLAGPYARMGGDLYRDEPVFRRELDRCADLLAPLLGSDIRDALHGDSHAPAALAVPVAAADGPMRTAAFHPAAFAVQYALARLWLSWGVRPAALLGHGAGEHVAACLAGVLPLEDVLLLVAEQARPQPDPARLDETARRMRLRAPALPLLSSLSGTWLSPAEAADPAYWVAHLSRPPRLPAALAELWRDPDRALLELGPGHLGSLALEHPNVPAGANRRVLASLPPAGDPRSATEVTLAALARLWLLGVRPDWPAFHAGLGRRRVSLPTYPFEGRRYWHDAPGVPRPLSALAGAGSQRAAAGSQAADPEPAQAAARAARSDA
jgi:acyl transferase domain-containing protein